MPPTKQPLSIYAGDYKRFELRDIVDADGAPVDYTTGFTFLAQIRAVAGPAGADVVAVLDVTAPSVGLLVLELTEAESEKLLALDFTVTDGDNSARATARWDLEVTDTATGRPATLLAGLVTVDGDVSRAVV